VNAFDKARHTDMHRLVPRMLGTGQGVAQWGYLFGGSRPKATRHSFLNPGEYLGSGMLAELGRADHGRTHGVLPLYETFDWPLVLPQGDPPASLFVDSPEIPLPGEE